MSDATVESLQQPFYFESPREYQSLLDRLGDRARGVLGTKEKSDDDRAVLLDSIHEQYPDLNGQAEQVAEDLELFHSEAEKKKEFSTWGYVKETAKKTWEIAKKYKWWLVGAAAVGLTAYGFYSGAIPAAYQSVKTWLGAQAWFTSISDKVSGFFTETIPDIVPELPEIPGMPDAPINLPPIPDGPIPPAPSADPLL